LVYYFTRSKIVKKEFVCGLLFVRFERFVRFVRFERFERFERFLRFGSKGSICSISSRGWGFRKARASFPYFLFLVSYSLFPLRLCSLASFARNKKAEAVWDF
jgi:hypothetical protein